MAELDAGSGSQGSERIVQRLRTVAGNFRAIRVVHPTNIELMETAADEIERLQGLWMDAQVTIEGLEERLGVSS